MTEPDGAPQNVRGHNTSSTSISVSWEEVQCDLQNGIITGYNITYESQTENDKGVFLAGPNDRQANLTGLKEFVEYNISAVAFTVKGDGPPSVIVVRTDQDSKLNYSLNKKKIRSVKKIPNGTNKCFFISKIHVVVYFQCSGLIRCATTRLYVIAH